MVCVCWEESLTIKVMSGARMRCLVKSRRWSGAFNRLVLVLTGANFSKLKIFFEAKNKFETLKFFLFYFIYQIADKPTHVSADDIHCTTCIHLNTNHRFCFHSFRFHCTATDTRCPLSALPALNYQFNDEMKRQPHVS